jgi:hypothetical protein
MSGFSSSVCKLAGTGPVLQCEQHFEEGRNACSGLEVADVGLDRSDRQRSGRGTACLAERPADGRGLDGIADRGSRTVRFHVRVVVGQDTEALVRGTKQVLLADRARRDHTLPAAVVVDGRSGDDAVDAIAVGKGARERLDVHDPLALAA